MVAITTTNILSSSAPLLWFCALLLTATTTTFSIIEGVDATGSSSTALPETVFWDNNWPSDLTLPINKAGDDNNDNNDSNNNGVGNLWSLSSYAYVISGQAALNEVDNDPNSDELTDIFNTKNADGGVGTYDFYVHSFLFSLVLGF